MVVLESSKFSGVLTTGQVLRSCSLWFPALIQDKIRVKSTCHGDSILWSGWLLIQF